MILVKVSKKAFAERANSARDNKIPLATNGGTNAVATATPTTATESRGETEAKAPAAPPASAIIKSSEFGCVRAMISLVMAILGWRIPIRKPIP